jgi:hypothetical protein
MDIVQKQFSYSYTGKYSTDKALRRASNDTAPASFLTAMPIIATIEVNHEC